MLQQEISRLRTVCFRFVVLRVAFEGLFKAVQICCQKGNVSVRRHAHVFRWHLKDAATTVFLALPTKAPCPESVQLEGWDGVWGDGTVAYWDPKLVDEADITRSIFAHSHQECSAVRDVEVWKAQNCRPSSF